uniref:NADH-ubiquinone oxidoreductase chain 5 n=1 Tax=Empoascanara angkhangica TaxID=3057149 RepID=A0AA51NHZ0_9HEMI|nr:NADH dehydrogenase subunit 5 [Empoascanara angkhangica]WMQ52407.1 NADH dehydrogenase subunit 5 [Empoascanara angkhangica]
MLKFNYYLYWGVLLLIISFIFFFYSMIFVSSDFSLILEWKILDINSFNVYYLILLDWISCLFISVVLLISSMVIFYSMNYMGLYNYSSNRFLFLVILFVLSMFLMIISPNLVSILLGWDGLGLVSYCLVIYYNSMKSYLAGMITCLTNRLGDIGLLISISWMMSFGSWHFMFYLDFFNCYLFYLIIISSFTKSAQIPFSTWLPAAMAAPTPVSSLVHSSTLVTAGVYLLIRFFNSVVYNNMYFLFISIMTMLMSSFCANYEFDLKKVIALSTLSQLGLMMSSLFMGLVNLSFFHLLTHAMFKSLLFLCAGIFIFYMNDNQDIRVMGSVCNLMPFTTSCFNISNLALCGVPFLSGFYSKDLILEMGMMQFSGVLYYLIFFFCLGLTCSYSVRLFYYSMLVNSKFKNHLLFFEEKNLMKFSIMVLTFFSVVFGCSILWTLMIDLTFMVFPLYMKIMPLMFVMLGFWVGYQMTELKNFFFSLSYYMFTNMWFMYSYSYYMYKVFYSFNHTYKMNLNWGEFYGSMGVSYYLLKISNLIQYYSMNNMKVMFLSFLIWFLLII